MAFARPGRHGCLLTLPSAAGVNYIMGVPGADDVMLNWQPRPGRTDAERNCISNIRSGALSDPQAATQLVFYLIEARRGELTGVTTRKRPTR